MLTSGGAACPRPVLDFFSSLGYIIGVICPCVLQSLDSQIAGLPILEGYGLTETSPIVCMNGLNQADRLLGTVGRPLKGVTIRVVDPETLLEVPPGHDGEVGNEY